MKRAFVLGLISSIFIGVLDPFFSMTRINYIGFTWEYWTPAAILFLFFFVVLSSIHRKFLLSSSELLLIFIMTSIASVIPTMGLVANIFPLVGGMRYFATPANNWMDIIVARTRSFMTVTDDQTLIYFYEGLPAGVAAPYMPWIVPLAVILGLYLLFAFFSVALMVIFRKQWVENEHLTFPLTILPIEMSRREGKSKITVLLKNKLFWTGFLIAFLLYFFNWLYNLATHDVLYRTAVGIPLFRRTISLRISMYMPIIGFAFLVPLNISLSLWLFHLLFTFQSGFFGITGHMLPGGHEPFGGRSAATTFQGGGGMVVLVGFLFWSARNHLRSVWRRACGARGEIDDSGEMLSYRVSVFGSIIAILAILLFFRYIGMTWTGAFAFLFFVLIIFIGLTRIVCQSGLPAARPQGLASTFTSYMLPSGAIGDQGYVAMMYQHTWTADIRSSVMAGTANALKIQKEAQIPPKVLFWAIMTAIVVTYVVASWITIRTGYYYGALNIGSIGQNRWFYGSAMSQFTAQSIIPRIATPMSWEIIRSRLIFFSMGAVSMLALLFLNFRLLWWPVHYIGFPIAESQPLIFWWFSIFIAWLIKSVILRYGGAKMYKKSIPVFLGLIVGSVLWMAMNVALNEWTGSEFMIGFS